MSLSRPSSSARRRFAVLIAFAAVAVVAFVIEAGGSGAPRAPRSTSVASAAAAKAASTGKSGRGHRAGRAARTRSKMAYSHLGRRDALALARKTFPEQVRPKLFSGAKLPGGAKIVAQRSKGMALVKTKQGKKALMVASQPVVAKNAEGKVAPVDLTLQQTPAGVAPVNSRAPFVVEPTSAAKVNFTGLGLGMSVAGAKGKNGKAVGAKSADGLVSDETTFFPNVLTDTDAGVSPLPYGSELYLIARSDDAPEHITLAFDLPTGATLRWTPTDHPLAGIGPQTIEIVQDDKPLAYVTPPVAYDADGQGIPASMRIDGQDIVLDVPHQDLDVHYPIAIDPEVVRAFSSGDAGWVGWHWTSLPAHNPDAPWGGAINNPTYYPGLYQALPKNQFTFDGNQAYFYYQPPPGTKITQTNFGGIAHSPLIANNLNHTQAFQAIRNPARTALEPGAAYRVTRDAHNPNTITSSVNVTTQPGYAQYKTSGAYTGLETDVTDPVAGASVQNNAIFGMLTLNAQGGGVSWTGAGTSADVAAKTTMAWSQVYISDATAPAWTGAAPASTGWTDDTASPTHQQNVSAHDDGLGLFTLTLDGAATVIPPTGSSLGADGKTLSAAPSCTLAPPAGICPHDWPSTTATPNQLKYTLNEGVNTLTATAQDLAGNPTTAPRTWTEKIDNSRPAIGTISGSLYDHRDSMTPRDSQTLTDPQYDLHIHATDQGSGVRSIEVRIGGTVVGHSDGACGSQGGCALTLDQSLSIDALNLNDGPYTVTITAYDYIQDPAAADRHKASTSFPIFIDRRGNVVHADQWDGAPTTQDSSNDAGQWAIPATGQARTEDATSSATLGTTSCPAGTCPQKTSVSDEDGAGGSPPAFERIIGATATDERVFNEFLTTRVPQGATSTGMLASVLADWQTPPPGHGSQFTRYRLTSTEIIDDASTAIIDDVYVDQATSLPVRQDHQEGDEPIQSVYYDYEKGRLESAGFPADFFSLTKPGVVESDTTTTLPPESSESPPPAETRAELLARSLDVRDLLNLTTDTTTVGQIVDDVTSPIRSLAMDLVGVPLTSAELATVEQLFDTQSHGEELAQFATAHPSAYGGSYLDAQDRLVVRLTQSAQNETLEQELRALIPIGNRLTIEAADTALATLEATQAAIEADITDGDLAAFDIRGVGVSQTLGQVTISLPTSSPAAEAQLQTRYGPYVRVDVAEPSEDMSRATAGRAMHVLDPDGDIHDPCTLGPNVYKRDANSQKRTYYALSAGHCGSTNPDRPEIWRFGVGSGPIIGKEVKNLVYGVSPNTPKVDALLIRIGRYSTQGNGTYANAHDRMLVRFDGSQQRYARVKGFVVPGPDYAVICWTGALTSHSQCGRVVERNRMKTTPLVGHIQHVTVAITHQNDDCEASDNNHFQTIHPGDSGSPVFWKNGSELGVYIYGILNTRACITRPDGNPYPGNDATYEGAYITEYASHNGGGLKDAFSVHLFCRPPVRRCQ